MQRAHWLFLLAPGAALGLGSLLPDAGEAHYVSSEVCASCHAEEWSKWQGSDHDASMALPSAATVHGDFEGAVFERGGTWARFVREGNGFTIESKDAGGAVVRHPVKYTFGTAPLQQYLVELPGGRIQPFPIAWDTERRTWFEVLPAVSPTDPLHWTGRQQSWSSMCADCHSTAVSKNHDPQTDTHATTFEELDVGCQSCHGPGSLHVAWASGDRSRPERGLLPVSRAREVETCAPCHSHRSPLSPKAVAGEPFTDHYRPSTLAEGLYFADGQIQGEVFEYGSFTQSKMFSRGVVCSDCHDPHRLEIPEGNAVCTRCHGAAPARFGDVAALRETFDDPAHHHHAPGSEGALCVSCHMPERTYMGVDGRRDHSFRVPRPELAEKLGTPDACTLSCHQEKTARWAAENVSRWFPGKKPVHYGEIFTQARRGEKVSPALVLLARTSTQPAIVRATALELLQADPEACLKAATSALADPSPIVREAALACGEFLPNSTRESWAGPKLGDPSRLVRLEAARLLAGVTLRTFDATAARAELQARHESQLDLPEGWFNLAVLAEAERKDAEAAAHYRRALELDPLFRPAIFNLVQLQARTGRHPEAEQTLRAAITRLPGDGELHYALGLLLGERSRWHEAEEALLEATRVLPGRRDVQRALDAARR